MSALTIGIVGFAVFFILIIIEIPIAFAMIAAGTLGIVLLRSPESAFRIMTDGFVSTFSSYTLGVVPMFILMGELAAQSQLGASIFDVAQKFVGHRRGGLAVAVQGVCALFGAICGSVAATVALMSGVAYPEMKKAKYSPALSTGSIVAGSGLAVLIPPSLTFIVYGLATQESIGKLFVSGIGTGVVFMMLFMLAVWIWVRIRPNAAPVIPKASRGERLHALRTGGLLEVVFVFALSMYGLFAGWFTPTEAGAVGSIGMLLVVILSRRFTFKILFDSTKNTIILACMIYMLMAGATIMGKFVTLSGLPSAIGDAVVGLGAPAGVVLVLITLIYLVLGCVMDGVAMLLITLPIFYPIVTETLGYSGLWFGAYSVVVLLMGGLTPPVGFTAFVCQGAVKEVPLTTVFKGCVPFVMAMLAGIVLLALFPQIATWLPGLVYR